MNHLKERNKIASDYYEQVNKAVDKKISIEHMKEIIDQFTQLQLEVHEREARPEEIDTLAKLVKLFEKEVDEYVG